MGVANDMMRAYIAPVSVFRARIGTVAREERALAVLMGACLLIFVAQWPRLQRQAFETGEDFQILVGGALFAWMFAMPLIAYTASLITHLLARLVGGKGTGFGARFALFWALLVASPLWLLWGLVAGFIGPGVEMSLVGTLAFGAFVVHWAINLWVAERG